MKRLKTEGLRKPADMTIARQRIFYARPQRTRAGKIAAGLPSRHVLNKLSLHASRKDRSATGAIGRKDMRSRAREISKYIWPCDYGLRSAFAKPVQSSKFNSYLGHDYTDRTKEIKAKGKMRAPKRLHSVLRLVAILLRKHSNTDYRRLLNLTCPSALPRHRLTSEECREIVESLCEVQHSQAFSQAGIYTQMHAASQTADEVTEEDTLGSKEKPRFTKYKSPQGCVSRFAQAAIRNLLPYELLGSQRNLRVVLKCERAADAYTVPSLACF